MPVSYRSKAKVSNAGSHSGGASVSKMASPPVLPIVNGMPVSYCVTQEQVDRIASSFKIRPDDVWIVTYPKAGTTWGQQIVRLVNNGGKDDGKKLDVAVPWIEALNTDERLYYQIPVPLEDIPSPRAMKSHFRYDNMPCGLPGRTPCKYIYIARNPKDVAVSFFHHHNAFKHRYKYDKEIKWDDFFRWFTDGHVAYGDFFDHVLSWWAHKDEPNVLFLKFEDMKKDLRATVIQIAKFIGKDLTEDEISTVVSKATFGNMQANPEANYSWISHRWDPNGLPFMRKGVVGDWVNYFSEEQSAEFDAKYAQRMNGSGLEFDFQ